MAHSADTATPTATPATDDIRVDTEALRPPATAGAELVRLKSQPQAVRALLASRKLNAMASSSGSTAWPRRWRAFPIIRPMSRSIAAHRKPARHDHTAASAGGAAFPGGSSADASAGPAAAPVEGADDAAE